jgi:YD repeat-containing protein
MGQYDAQAPRRVSATLLGALVVAAVGRVWAGVPALPQVSVPAAGCRAYSTDETRLSTTGTLRVKCTYETSTNQHVCHEQYSGGSAPGYSFVQTTQFGSVADFVGDPSRVAFFPRAETITVKFPSSTSTQSYSYDARGYLAKITTLSNAGSGGSMVQTFTAWDGFGRPTAGRDDKQTYALTYDDVQRVVTMKISGLPSVITVKLDANSNQVATTTVNPNFKDTTTITIHATQEICK